MQRYDRFTNFLIMQIAGAFSLLASLIFTADEAWAGYGLNMLGFGVESISMSGADIPFARDTLSLNTNPAGLAETQASRLDVVGGLAYALGNEYADDLNQVTTADNEFAFVMNGGYAQRLEGSPLTLGFGVFGQGGAGAVYKDIATPFGTTDEMSSLFRIAKASVGGSYEAGPTLSFGMALSVLYADIDQKIFPGTSYFDGNPANTFFGNRLQGASGIAAGVKLGTLWRPNDNFRAGLAYTSASKLDMTGGKLIANMSSIGLGQVTYGDAEITGMTLPQDVGIGIAFRPREDLWIAIEGSWVNYDAALNGATLKANNPDDAGAPSELQATNRMDWDDQYIGAVGAAWSVGPTLTLYGGYSIATNPIPEETMSPLMGPFAQRHLTAGMTYAHSGNWQFGAALEYQLPQTKRFSNPDLPLSDGTILGAEYVALYLQVTRKF